MRRSLHILMALVSCCFLCFSQGCGSQDSKDIQHGQDAKQDPKQNPSTNSPTNNNSNVHPTLPGDQAPILPSPPGLVPVLPGAGPAGGGSQGSEEPARTNNPDDDPFGIIEVICDDGIDNDEDGFTDCDDTDCALKPCNDENGCTLQDICVSRDVCEGTPVNCEVELVNTTANECDDAVCQSISSAPGDDNYKCNLTLDTNKTEFGSCTPDDNCDDRNPDGTCADIIDRCIVGRCEIMPAGPEGSPPEMFICVGQDKVKVDEPAGCNDNNPCTSDLCQYGECTNSSLQGALCDDGDPCTFMDACNMTMCQGMPVTTCRDSTQCGKGSSCFGAVPGFCQNGSATGGPCFLDSDCPENFDCNGEGQFGACTCDDGNECTGIDGAPDLCDTGDANLNALAIGDCLPGGFVEEETPCDDDNACTSGDACDGDGDCEGQLFPNNCTTPGQQSNCPSGSTCTTVSPGVNRCSCVSDDFSCTTQTCSNGICDAPLLDDDDCETDEDVCTTQECTEEGCVTTLMDGPMLCFRPVQDPTDDPPEFHCLQGRLQCNKGVSNECVADDPPVEVDFGPETCPVQR